MASNVKRIQRPGVNYTGPCMQPVLRPGDGLRVVPYDGKAIRRGDVVVFRPPGRTEHLVHRVIASGPEGVRTRGDHNLQDDPWVLAPKDIAGRVKSARRGARTVTISGGASGLALGLSVRMLRRIEHGLLGPIYRALCRSGGWSVPVLKWVRPEILLIHRPEGDELQLLIGRQVITRSPAGTEEWQVKPLWRLFLQ